MKVADLSPSAIAQHLQQEGLLLGLSPFTVSIRTDIEDVARNLTLMYREFSVVETGSFADFHVELPRASGIRRWIRPQVNFYFDGIPSFQPLPLDHAYPMLEWGLNWCIASHSHGFLIVHAAVIEKDGRAAIMPAPPGSGKSTLCAGLVSRGWRLLSDELTLIRVGSGLLQPMARPINLKNQSIDVIKRFQPNSVMTPPVKDTKKGTVSLMRPPADSVRRVAETAQPAWIVFPQFTPGARANFSAISKATTCLRVASESFNYHIHGRTGFDTVTELVDKCDCLEFEYGDLEEAARQFAQLAESSP